MFQNFLHALYGLPGGFMAQAASIIGEAFIVGVSITHKSLTQGAPLAGRSNEAVSKADDLLTSTQDAPSTIGVDGTALSKGASVFKVR